MNILLISSYHGGSHRAWADGYRQFSTHAVMHLTLPARFWKWRMHGGAVTLARRFLESDHTPDLILATDMLDLTTFLALTRQGTSAIPTALYMHENQLTYPLPADRTTGPMRRQLGERDRHYAFINFASMMAADRIFFNSQFHHDSFLAALPNFLKHFPEYNELGSIEVLRRKSEVLAVGIDLQRLHSGDSKSSRFSNSSAPLVLWNQRWEYDKNPADFFAALKVVADEGIPFRVALCGQQYGQQPAAFAEGLALLGDRIVHAGYVEADKYGQLLQESDITVSTAQHEFFGISIVEAIYSQTFPILPARLSYPEIVPPLHHAHCLYENQEILIQRLRWAVTNVANTRRLARELAGTVSRFDWRVMAPRYDEKLGHLVS